MLSNGLNPRQLNRSSIIIVYRLSRSEYLCAPSTNLRCINESGFFFFVFYILWVEREMYYYTVFVQCTGIVTENKYLLYVSSLWIYNSTYSEPSTYISCRFRAKRTNFQLWWVHFFFPPRTTFNNTRAEMSRV